MYCNKHVKPIKLKTVFFYSHIGVYGEAQNPQVCFLECDKVLPEVYLQVPLEFNAILHNQTLLPTTYTFGKVMNIYHSV